MNIKVFIAVLLILCGSFSFGQTPNNNLNNSNANTTFGYLGPLTSNGYKVKNFANLNTLNAQPFLRGIPGLMVKVGDVLYYRSADTTTWIALAASTSPPINIGNYIVSVDSIATVDSTVTYFAPIVYVQNGVTQTKGTNQALTVNTVPSGYNRADAVYIDSTGNFQIKTGQSDTVLTSPPVIPPNAILVGYITINGSVVTASPPATGVNYWTQGGDTTFIPFFGSKNNINVGVIRNNITQYYLEPTRIRVLNNILMDTAAGRPLNDRNSVGITYRGGNNLDQTRIDGVDGSTGGSTGGKGIIVNSGSFSVTGSGQFETNYPAFSYQDVSGIDHQNLGLFKVRNSSTTQSGNVFNITKHNSANSPKPLVNVGYNAVTVIQDSINGAAASSAQVDIRSTSKGILIPRMTGAQMNAIATPTTGTLVQCIDSSNSPFCYYTGSGWRKLLSATGGNATFTGVTDVIVDTATNTICVITTTATNCYPLSGDSVRIVGDTAICIYTNGSPDCYESNGDTLVVSGGIDSFTVIGNVACAWDNGSSICFNINNSNGYVDAAVLSGDSTTYDFYSGSTYLFSLPTLLRNVIAGNSGIYISDTTISGNPYTVIYNTGSGGGSGWSLTGNTGTDTTTNFIGTTDNMPLQVRANGNRVIANFQPDYGVMLGQLNLASSGGLATGYNTIASGTGSFTSGLRDTATAQGSVAIGVNGKASGDYSLSTGQSTKASGVGAASFGLATNASGDYSIAMGEGSQATDENAVAIGDNAVASGYKAIAIGQGAVTASGENAIAIGNATTSTGDGSVAIGSGANGTIDNSVAIGSSITVLQSGEVGINTTTPDSAFTVVGGLHFDMPTKGNGKVLTSDANGNATWQTAGGGSSQWTDTLTGAITYPGDIYAGGRSLFNGNVGIGTTIPDSTLTVVGGLHFDLPTKGAGKVLKSDANGNATWQTESGGGISALTGDVTASGTGSVAATLATVNSNVGSFGSATQSPAITVNGKGLITAVSNTTITPAVGSITGFGSGVATWLATASSANLRAALPDESGNGAALFQNGDLGVATGTSLALGSTLGSSAILELTSTTKAFYKPRMTTAQMNAVSGPAAGAEIYNTDEGSTFTYSTDWGWESDNHKWRTKFGTEYFNDFLGIYSTATGSLSDGNLTTFASGGVAASLVTPPTNRQGIIELSTSTSATGRAGVGTSIGTTAQSMILGGGRLLYEVNLQVPTLSTSGERYQLLAGLTSSNSGVNVSNGVMFLYDEGGVSTGSAASANWQVYTAAASSRTFTTTSVAVTAGQWYRLAAVVNAAGTSVGFYIDGTLVRTETATIPTAAIGISNQIFKSVGTTARTAQIDYIYFKQKYTTPK